MPPRSPTPTSSSYPCDYATTYSEFHGLSPRLPGGLGRRMSQDRRVAPAPAEAELPAARKVGKARPSSPPPITRKRRVGGYEAIEPGRLRRWWADHHVRNLVSWPRSPPTRWKDREAPTVPPAGAFASPGYEFDALTGEQQAALKAGAHSREYASGCRTPRRRYHPDDGRHQPLKADMILRDFVIIKGGWR